MSGSKEQGQRAAQIMLLSLLATLSVCINTAESAIIYGQTYSWDTLEPVGDVIIALEKDGAIIQQIVSKDGRYSFEVSPGEYVLIAKQTEKDLVARENVSITSDVNYRYDMILLPNLEVMEITDLPEFPEEVLAKEEGHEFPYYLAAIAISGLILIFMYHLKRRGEEEKERDAKFKHATESETELDLSNLPEDLQEIVRILRSVGGRITQKELRKRLGCSEAKMSLMIADLERRGIVEKVKKGRGNIIFLKFI